MFIFISRASVPFASSFEFGPRTSFVFLFIKSLIYFGFNLIVRVNYIRYLIYFEPKMPLIVVSSKCCDVSFRIVPFFVLILFMLNVILFLINCASYLFIFINFVSCLIVYRILIKLCFVLI